MKAFVYFRGDSSVGIFSHTTTIDEIGEIDSHEQRFDIRDLLANCFSEIFDGSVDVYFEDECPDCYGIKQHSKSCPSMQLAEKGDRT